MKLDKSYKVKVNPGQSREIQELLNRNPTHTEFCYMRIAVDDFFKYGFTSNDSVFAQWEEKEITASKLIALLSQKETKMPNLSDFLKCEKVRCVSDDYRFLTKGKEYNLGFIISVIDDEDDEVFYEKDGLLDLFEPVIETAPHVSSPPKDQAPYATVVQATDSLDDTPMGTRTEFKVGDMLTFKEDWCTNMTYLKKYPVLEVRNDGIVTIDDKGEELVFDFTDFLSPNEPVFNFDDSVYLPNTTNLICKIQKDKKIVSSNGEYVASFIGGGACKLEFCCHATPENYEMLCKLYPHIDFEKPPVLLQGSDLCRAMLDKGWKRVLCKCSNTEEGFYDKDETRYYCLIKKYENGKFIEHDGGLWQEWNFATPFDPKTGEILTSEVLEK